MLGLMTCPVASIFVVFRFDRVFDRNAKQEEIFENVAQPVVDKLVYLLQFNDHGYRRWRQVGIVVVFDNPLA